MHVVFLFVWDLMTLFILRPPDLLKEPHIPWECWKAHVHNTILHKTTFSHRHGQRQGSEHKFIL